MRVDLEEWILLGDENALICDNTERAEIQYFRTAEEEELKQSIPHNGRNSNLLGQNGAQQSVGQSGEWIFHECGIFQFL